MVLATLSLISRSAPGGKGFDEDGCAPLEHLAAPGQRTTARRVPSRVTRFHSRRGKERLRQYFDAKIVHETVIVPL